MEIYLLKYSGGWKSNTYPTRMRVYLHTFCLHRVRCSPFLLQLLCLTHQWEKTSLMGGDIKTTPNPSFDLTKGMDVLLLYLQLSRTAKDDYHIVQIAKEDIFYDSNDSDKLSEESEHVPITANEMGVKVNSTNDQKNIPFASDDEDY